MVLPFLSFEVLLKAGLLIGGILWCFHVIGRLPRDISELRDSYRKYRTRKDPEIVGGMKEDQRSRYQDDCAVEFWTILTLQAVLFWPVTAAVLFYVVTFTVFGIIRPLLQLF